MQVKAHVRGKRPVPPGEPPPVQGAVVTLTAGDVAADAEQVLNLAVAQQVGTPV